MRRLSPVLALTAGLAACAPEPFVWTVVTLDVRRDEDWWQDRFPLIADEIARLEPDVVALQNLRLSASQAELLDRMIGERSDVLAFDRDEVLRTGLDALTGEGLAVLSRYPIAARASRDLGMGRVVMFDRVRVSDRLTIDVFNTALDDRGTDEERRAQLRRIVALRDELGRDNPAILAGNLAATPASLTLDAALDAGFVDTWAAVNGPDGGLTWPVPLARMPVVLAPQRRIDYVLFDAPAGVTTKVLSSSVAFDRPSAEGLYPSDHLGVVTTIELDLATLD
ncbi:endonuclease/exonuclease/phosphatase family protein [Myxococcota bacterium]|nr:endonuclease/exonuclease/phosphatase family protein [Myxococcota bacterium]